MQADTLTALAAYNAYANNLVFTSAEALGDEQFRRESGVSHSSVQRTLRHMLATERGFLGILRGVPAPRLELETLAEIREKFVETDADFEGYIAGLDAEETNREVLVDFDQIQLKLPVWKILLQVLLHATHHRGELSIIMTGLGCPLPTLDIIAQFAQQDGQEWPWM